MKKEPKKSYYIKKADTLFSLYWRKKIGYCEKCGKREGLQLAHIITRGCMKLRYEPKNKFVLCGGCHLFWAHKCPLEFAEFVKERKGEEVYKWLIEESRKLEPLAVSFYKEIISKLNELMKSL